MSIFKLFKDLIAPKKCYNCWVESTYLCKKCVQEIGFFESICPYCKQISRDFETHFYCKRKHFYLDKIIIFTHYKNTIIKKLIKDAKFYGKKDILEDISFYLWEKLFLHIQEKKQEVILVSTPMYFWKKFSRWYNQSEILVKNIANNFWLNYTTNLFKKSKWTKPQSHLSKIERIENLKWVFYINEKEFSKHNNKVFILVDDVVSTWTTFNECAKLLKNKWIKTIYWLSIASD